MNDNPNGTVPEQPIKPTVVDNFQEVEVKASTGEATEEMVSKESYDNLRSLGDRRHSSYIEQFTSLAKINPQLLKDMDWTTEESRKLRDSVTKRVFPQFTTYEQAQEYIDNVDDPKVAIDAKINEESIKLEAYLDALAEFNETYKDESQRIKFKDEFRSFVTTLPYEERLAKTKSILWLNTTKVTANTTPISGSTQPANKPGPTKEEEEKAKRARYEAVRALIK